MNEDNALLSGDQKCSAHRNAKTATFTFSPFLTCSLYNNLLLKTGKQVKPWHQMNTHLRNLSIIFKNCCPRKISHHPDWYHLTVWRLQWISLNSVLTRLLTPLGGGYFYIIKDMDVRQGLSTLTLCRPKFRKILDPLQTKGEKVLKIYTPKRRKMYF